MVKIKRPPCSDFAALEREYFKDALMAFSAVLTLTIWEFQRQNNDNLRNWSYGINSLALTLPVLCI